MPSYQLDEEVISKILKKHSLGELHSVKEIPTGLINAVYLLNDNIILRIDLENENNLSKFHLRQI